MSMRSCASPISPIAHITFCTFDDVVRPQIFMVFLPISVIASEAKQSPPRRMCRGDCFGVLRTPRNDSEKSLQPPRFLGQHDRNAVADRIGELGGARDQLLLL